MNALDQAAIMMKMVSLGHPWENDRRPHRRDQAKTHYSQCAKGISFLLWKSIFSGSGEDWL